MISKIEFGGIIVNGELSYDDKPEKIREKFLKLKKENEQKDFIWSIEIVDKARHFQHKYYRGFLLPDVAFAMGERDTGYVHYLVLKKQFMFNRYEGYEKIPQKYRSRAFLYYNQNVTADGEVHNPDIYGWSPSCGDINYEDMKEFILKVEHLLFVDLESHLGVSGGSKFKERQEQAANMRDSAEKAHEGNIERPADDIPGQLLLGEDGGWQ